MNENTCVELIGRILGSLDTTIDEAKRCLFSRDRRRLIRAEKAFAAGLKSSLPLCETIIAKKEKLQSDQEILALLPSLQRLGIAGEELLHGARTTLEAEVSLTDKAFGEISEVMALVKDLARDTNDALATGNARFRAYARAEANHAIDRMEEYGLDHEQRLARRHLLAQGIFRLSRHHAFPQGDRNGAGIPCREGIGRGSFSGVRKKKDRKRQRRHEGQTP